MADLKQLGKYSVIEVLGKGAMGVVYKGYDPMIDRHVALKTVRKEVMDQHLAGEIIARFKNEAQAAGRLTHPGIVAIYDYGEDDTTAFIAMEFVQGHSLRHYLSRQEPFALQGIVSIMGELLHAIDYAHEHGVVHRDIKPANIIMMTNGRLKVADFGIARIDRSSLTTVGSVMGTPSYMSPEQYAGLPVDRRTDIFSSGVVLYELLTGSKPFEGATDTSIAYKICHEPHRNPSEVNPQAVPTVFDAVIAKALAKKAEDRYATAKEFANAVLAAYETRGNVPADAEPTVRHTIAPFVPDRQDTTFPPPGWNPKDLLALEELFAPHVGPIAKVLIKKAAKTTTDGRQFLRLLTDSIQGEEEKKAFLADAFSRVPDVLASSAATGQTDVSRGSVSYLLKPIDPADVEKATGRLAMYLGPIAKVVAKKAAAQTTDVKALYLRLADSLASAEDREKFLKDAGYS
jgi:serine/threonine protein kinase